jgi:hypothetical protein
MLQLATLSARDASEVPDLLITPGSRAAPCAVLHTPQKLFRTGLAVTVAVRNLDDRQLHRLIGAGYMIVNEAGYMIVNEVAPTRAGCGANPHSRWRCEPDPSSSRSPTRARGVLVSPKLEVRRERCRAFSAKGILPNARKEQPTLTPQAFMRSTRSSGWARSSRWQRDRTRTHGRPFIAIAFTGRTRSEFAAAAAEFRAGADLRDLRAKWRS